MLERTGARAFHHLDHFRRIPLLTKTAGARFSAVPRGNDDHGLRGIGKGRIPGHPQHVIQEAAVELILALCLRRQLRGAGIHPLLPALPHQGPLESIGAIDTTVEGKALQTHAWVVGKGSAVAVEVFIGLVVIVLFDPHHHAVADEGPDAAGMRIIRRADPGEGRVVAVLVVVDTLPGPIWIVPQRVPDFDHRLKCRQRQHIVRDRHGRDRPGRHF